MSHDKTDRHLVQLITMDNVKQTVDRIKMEKSC